MMKGPYGNCSQTVMEANRGRGAAETRYATGIRGELSRRSPEKTSRQRRVRPEPGPKEIKMGWHGWEGNEPGACGCDECFERLIALEGTTIRRSIPIITWRSR